MAVTEDENELLDPVNRWAEEVGTIYDLVSAGPRTVFQEAGFVPVEPEIASRIQAEAGLTVIGCLHIMDTDSIRHIIKKHGEQKEILRGQSPLTREDFLLLPTIFGNPYTIGNGGKTKQGRVSLSLHGRIADKEKPPCGGNVLQEEKLEARRQMHLPTPQWRGSPPLKRPKRFGPNLEHYTPV